MHSISYAHKLTSRKALLCNVDYILLPCLPAAVSWVVLGTYPTRVCPAGLGYTDESAVSEGFTHIHITEQPGIAPSIPLLQGRHERTEEGRMKERKHAVLIRHWGLGVTRQLIDGGE